VSGEIVLYAILLILTIPLLIKRLTRRFFPLDSYLQYLWAFFLVLTIAELVSFVVAVWILAVMCFVSLREYFSLVDIRRQDRWGILGAFISIPFMIYFIQIDWYGMFIISIPVYAFLLIPFFVTLGGKQAEGIIFSIGAIDFGLFLFVYCFGHIGYLALFSTWKAAMLILCVAICDIISFYLYRQKPLPVRRKELPRWRRAIEFYVVSVLLVVILIWGLSAWTGITGIHILILGVLIPAMVAMGRHTIFYIQEDLKITDEDLHAGRGQNLYHIRSFLYSAPVVFHYIRYFLT
jgi:phosphatidate cytidylyltransferase